MIGQYPIIFRVFVLVNSFFSFVKVIRSNIYPCKLHKCVGYDECKTILSGYFERVFTVQPSAFNVTFV